VLHKLSGLITTAIQGIALLDTQAHELGAAAVNVWNQAVSSDLTHAVVNMQNPPMFRKQVRVSLNIFSDHSIKP